MRLEDHLDQCSNDLKILIQGIGHAAIEILNGFYGHQSVSTTMNVYGERQLAIDKWADEVLVSYIKESGLVRQVASEERPDICVIDEATGDLGVTLDPLDGSSLIGTNLSVGSIVGIYRGSVLSPGCEMLCALYVLYGPMTTLTCTTRDGVNEYRLDRSGCFVLQRENLAIPEGKTYSPGALRKDYLPTHRDFIEMLEKEGYKLRYSGSFVADVNLILRKGGVFSYPASREHSEGKLRLLFEANPMGFIVAQGGGRVSDGFRDTLSIEPQSISQRTPVYIGGKKEIALIEELNSEEV